MKIPEREFNKRYERRRKKKELEPTPRDWKDELYDARQQANVFEACAKDSYKRLGGVVTPQDEEYQRTEEAIAQFFTTHNFNALQHDEVAEIERLEAKKYAGDYSTLRGRASEITMMRQFISSGKSQRERSATITGEHSSASDTLSFMQYAVTRAVSEFFVSPKN